MEAQQKQLLVAGNAKASSVQSNFYNESFYFNASGDKLTVPNSSGDFDFGSGDFTIESYIHIDAENQGDAIINLYNYTSNRRAWNYYFQGNDDGIEFLISTDGSSQIKRLDSDVPIQKNKWVHVAVTKASNVYRMFFDGIEVDSATVSETIYGTGTTSDSVGIGDYAHTNAEPYNGYISDIRIYKGVAKYTSNFVVPSKFPDVLPDTPSGVAGGSKLAKITDGAVVFEGNATTKLTLADSTDFTFGTNDFCIEFFYYNKALPDNGTYDIIFDCMGSNRSGIQLAIETDNDYRIEVGDGASNWIWQSTGFDSKSRKWTHFALTREGSTFRAFEDGVLLGTQTSSTAVGDPRSPAIGGYASDDSTNYGFNGYISNFRIVNGSAVYTAAFTPSTAPLTNVTNTKLLCCQSPTSATTAAVSPGSITAAGDAAATIFNPFNTDINRSSWTRNWLSNLESVRSRFWCYFKSKQL